MVGAKPRREARNRVSCALLARMPAKAEFVSRAVKEASLRKVASCASASKAGLVRRTTPVLNVHLEPTKQFEAMPVASPAPLTSLLHWQAKI